MQKVIVELIISSLITHSYLTCARLVNFSSRKGLVFSLLDCKRTIGLAALAAMHDCISLAEFNSLHSPSFPFHFRLGLGQLGMSGSAALAIMSTAVVILCTVSAMLIGEAYDSVAFNREAVQFSPQQRHVRGRTKVYKESYK